MSDAGPLDLLVELSDRNGGRHDFVDFSARAVGYEVGDLTVLLASLDDIVASKEFAGRDKDRDALPEPNTSPRAATGWHQPISGGVDLLLDGTIW